MSNGATANAFICIAFDDPFRVVHLDDFIYFFIFLNKSFSIIMQ